MSQCTLRVARFKTNPLLQRKQFILEVAHPDAPPVAKDVIREQLATIYKVNDLKRIVVGDFQTKFGGGKSLGFGRIYDSAAAAVKFERNYRLARLGIVEVAKKPMNRGLKKTVRNQRKKVRGTAKAKVSGSKK